MATTKQKIRRALTVTRVFRPSGRFRYWVIPLALVLLIVSGWWVRQSLSGTVKRNMAASLQTILDSDVTAIRIWLEAQKSLVNVLADSDRVRRRVAELASVPVDDEDPGLLLLASPAQFELREQLRAVTQGRGYAGFVVLDLNGRWISALSDDVVGRQVGEDRKGLVARALAGETVISQPYMSVVPLPDHEGGPPIRRPVMFAGAPVKDGDGTIVGGLFIRIRPEVEFTPILHTARIESSGETYAFNARGLLISNSRFDDQLRDIGLLPADTESRAILNLEIRDPGGDLLQGFRSNVDRGALPLTRMAASAVTGNSGVDIDGYRDYRGVKVIGAWTWLPEYDFGVATEIDYAETTAMPAGFRRVFWAVIVVLSVIGLGIVAESLYVSRLGKQMESAVLEARKLGQYTLERKIGAGGMGEVYRARHAMLRRPTAIKLLNTERASPEAVARFEQEVQITSRLTHPNTIAIFDYGRTPDGVFYYAMEFLPGIHLARLVEDDGPQTPGRVIHILRQVCGSLEEAHRAGLVHRDIKPENVILCERGGSYDVAKVLDFGIVKNLGGAEAAPVTMVGAISGTPLYMSPEALRTPETMDARADLYAVGALGYFLVTGKPVFEGTNVMDILAMHINTAPTSPSERLGNPVPEDLEQVILSCLAKDPRDRPATAADLAEALQNCAAAGEWTQRAAAGWWARHGDLVIDDDTSTESENRTGHTATVVVDNGGSHETRA